MIDIIRELEDYGIEVQVCDPHADPAEAVHEYGVTLCPVGELRPAAAVVAAVSHEQFRAWGSAELSRLMGANPVLVDVKGIYDQQAMKAAGMRVWRL